MSFLNKLFGDYSKKERATVSWSFGEAIRYLYADRGYEAINETNAFSRHVWVYVCINLIARTIAHIPYKIYPIGSDKEIKDPKNQAYILFNNITNDNSMDKYQFWEGLTIYKQFCGNAFVYPVKASKNIVTELNLLDASKMKPILSKDDSTLIGWKYGNIPLATDDVIQFKYFNPYDKYVGLSPLKTAMNSVEIDDLSMQFNKSVVENGSFPGGVVQADHKLTDAQFARTKKEIEDSHKGAAKAGKLLLLEGGLKYQELKITPEELKYIEQRELSKNEIHAIYHVSTALTGDTKAFNRANMGDIKKEFYTKTIIPELRSYEENMNSNFFRIYFPQYEGRFDFSEIRELQEEFKDVVTMAKDLFLMGFTRNEINDKLNMGFQKVAWGDHWWIQPGMVTADSTLEDNKTQEGQEQNPQGGKPVVPEKNLQKMIDAFTKFVDPKHTQSKKNYVIWKSLMTSILPIEKDYKKKISRFMFELRQEILNNFFSHFAKSMDKNTVLFNSSEARIKFKAMSKQFIEAACKKAGDTALSEIAKKDISTQFDMSNEDTIRKLQQQLEDLGLIFDTLDEQTIEIIKQGVEEGLTTDEIAQNLRDMMDMATNRSNMIARTEIMSAANMGRYEAYDQAGITRVYWIDSKDLRVRGNKPSDEYDHNLESEEVDYGEEFSCGLKYPGDRDGSEAQAGNIINCRCTLGAVVDTSNPNEDNLDEEQINE